jgi:glycosyltransferase involved in cell wall biosynthesis
MAGLQELAVSAGVGDLFEFRTGFIPDPELPALFGSADILAYPYREIEASGSFLLGLTFGIPIVASRIGLFREILQDDVHGKLVEPEDAEGLSLALECLTTDAAFRRKAAHKISELAERIPSWKDIAVKTADEYRERIPATVKEEWLSSSAR